MVSTDVEGQEPKPFLLDWQRPDEEPVAIDPYGGTLTPARLRSLSRQARRDARGGVALLFCDQSLVSISRFVAMLEAGVAVLPLDCRMREEAAANLIAAYEPELVLLPDLSSPLTTCLDGYDLAPDGWCVARRTGPPVHPDLAVLLTTSGSTGSPKLVRLSRGNIHSNANSIAQSLGLRPTDRVVTSLPLHYSFGMSLVTSHLLVGSSVLVSDRSVLDRAFWKDLDAFNVTHFAGVPITYAMLKRVGFGHMELPSLRALLQAGGRLNRELVAEFHALAQACNREFFVMYGQTEAGPRMACLPPDRLPEKLGSAGIAIPGGRFEIRDDNDCKLPSGTSGEIVYHGPNVMMGYAQSRADLAREDEMNSVLHTGDIGYLDSEGFLYITGRTKRIAKVSGVRVSLDEVEEKLSAIAPVAAVAAPEDGIVVYTCSEGDIQSARRALARDMGLAGHLIVFRQIAALPELSSGKIDYALLTKMAAEQNGRP